MLKYFPPKEFKKPTKKSAKETTKSKFEVKETKEPEKKEPEKKEHEDEDNAKKRDEKLGNEPEKDDVESEDEEMETEKNIEKDEGNETNDLIERIVGAGEDESSLIPEEMQKKEGTPNYKEEMKKVEELQNGRKIKDEGKVTDTHVRAGEDKSSSRAEEMQKKEEKRNYEEEMKKVGEMQKRRKNEKGDAEITISKNQKQEDISDDNEAKEQEDVEMTK